MNNAKKLLMNTAILTAASIVMQVVGVSFNVYLTNRIGSAGIGLFQLVMTVYALSVTLACGGVRLASTRLSVDADSARGSMPRKAAVRCCIRYALAVSLAVGTLLLAFSGLIAEKWLDDPRTATPLRMLAVCLPFVSMSSALAGYFTSTRRAVIYSAVQGGEQAVKIVTVALVLAPMLSRGAQYASEAIVLGMCLSEIFAFVCLYIIFRATEKSGGGSALGVLKSLTRIALPDVTGAATRSVLLTIEHLLIPKGFKKSGASPERALGIYGAIHGMALPILLFPSCLPSSLAGLLVPEIAEMAARGRRARIDECVTWVLRLTILFSTCVGAVIYAFAGELSSIIYNNSEPVEYLRLLAFLVPVMYTDTMTDGMLKGLDQQLYTMRYNILDSALCVILVYFLLPLFAVKGYIFVLFASEIINFYLSLRRLVLVCNIEVSPVRDVIMPCGCAVVCAAAVKAFAGASGFAATGKISLALGITLAAGMYFTLIGLFGCISRADAGRLASLVRPVQPSRVTGI